MRSSAAQLRMLPCSFTQWLWLIGMASYLSVACKVVVGLDMKYCHHSNTLVPVAHCLSLTRTDLLSEVLRDIDVMPLDPSEALPLALLHAHMQPLLNGRPTTAAGAQALSSAAGALAARRRQQQLLLAAAQQQQMRAAGLNEQEAKVDQQLLSEISGGCLRRIYEYLSCTAST